MAIHAVFLGLPAVYGHYENGRIDSAHVLGAKRCGMEKNVKADKKGKVTRKGG